MIDRELASNASNYWRQSDMPGFSPAQRLEAKLTAFQMIMTSIIGGVDNVQRFWDSTDLLTALVTAEAGAALDEGGTITKEAVIKYQTLFRSFQNWLNTEVSADLPTGTIGPDGNMVMMPMTLEETPAQLIMRRPESVVIPQP